MAQLAGGRGVHHCGIHTHPCAALPCKFDGLEITSSCSHRSGNSTRSNDCRLHSLFIRASKSSRHVAKPSVTTPLVCAGSVAWICSVVAAIDLYERDQYSLGSSRATVD